MKEKDYSVQPKGFWHSVDRVAEKVGQSKIWSPFKKIGQSLKSAWNSKPLAPIKWITSKATEAINKVMNHPFMQFAGFAVGMTLAGMALATAAPAAIPLAAATVGIVAGGKIIKTAYEARKSYRTEQLETQLQLLKKLESTHKSRDQLLEHMPQTHQELIKPQLTQRYSEQALHQRNIKARSRIIAEEVAANLLSIVSTAVDFTQLPRHIHSVSKLADVASTSNDTRDTISQPKEEIEEYKDTFKTENQLRAEINSLSTKLDIPKMKDNTELRQFVAESIADTVALSKIDPKSPHPLSDFSESKSNVIKEGTHLNSLPTKQNAAKRAAVHVGNAFFGIESQKGIESPPVTPQNISKEHSKTR